MSTMSEEATNPFVDYARTNPGSTAMLAGFIAVGAVGGWYFFADILPPVRATLGGAVAGFGSWLLVVVRKVIDGH